MQLFRASGVLVLNELNTVQTQPTGPQSLEFMTFMRAYQNMVFSTAARLAGSDAQAEDISQEVFMRAYEHFDELKTSPTAGGWLKTVTTHLTLNYVTRYRRRWRFFSELGDTSGSDESSTREADWEVPDTVLADRGQEEQARMVDEALRRLPQHQRLALVLYHFEDLPYQEVAEKLKVSLAKVKTDISRGRAALLPLLAANGFVRESL